LLERVAAAITHHSMFRPGDRVAVAVSGGADSVALLDILVRLAPRWNLRLRVAHLNHKLRGEESEADARFVAGLAAGHGLAFDLREVDIARVAATQKENLEQAARRARLAFFHDLIAGGAADRVALGHTRSDQAETVLFRLLRGSGITGLAGIWPVSEAGLVRPLLEVSRDEVRAYLAARNLVWREDATNRQLELARNRIRHELLPELARDWNPELEAALARLARVAQAEEIYWRQEIDRLAACEIRRQGEAVLMRCSRLRELPEAVARRLLRRAIELGRGSVRRLEFDHIERLIELAGARQGTGGMALPGLRVERSFDWLRLAPAGQAPYPDFPEIPLEVPGTFAVPGRTWRLRLEIASREEGCPAGKGGYNTGGGDLDISLAAGGLKLRSWRAGDVFHPSGWSSAVKLKELFGQARIPVWDRPGWPIITYEGRIAWVWRFGAAEGFQPRPGARQSVRVLEVNEERGG
jgi:tRNA(Ile)-lysidine synthase